jgi:hypothetical protein
MRASPLLGVDGPGRSGILAPMRPPPPHALAVTLAGLAALAACSTPRPEPEIASAATLGAYAKTYPTELDAEAKRYGDRKAEAQKEMTAFSDYPGKLKDPDWSIVLDVVRRADQDGRAYAYVERSRRVEAVAAFFDAEKDEINRKVAGTVSFVAKKKGCDADVGSGVGSALKDVVEKQLEKELDDVSEAHQIVERNRLELGKENAAELDRQADEVSRASYVVHVALVEDKVRLTRMVADGDQVKRTADDEIAAERAFQTKKITDPEKKASEARIADMTRSKAAVDASVQRAQAMIPKLDEEIQQIKKTYDDDLAGLESKIRDKTKH